MQNIEEKQRALISCAIEYVYKELSAWNDREERTKESSEKCLNQDLSKFLCSEASKGEQPFLFMQENQQGEGRTIDIAAFLQNETREDVAVFECKRLPAPESARTDEYVTGHEKITGGIQRFKLNKHGRKYPVAAMIGYVQQETFQVHQQHINFCIQKLSKQVDSDGLAWDESECLTEVCSDTNEVEYISVHPRKANENIKLYHLWIDMTAKE